MDNYPPLHLFHYRIALNCLGQMGQIRSSSCHWTYAKPEALRWVAERRSLNEWDIGELMHLDTLHTELIAQNRPKPRPAPKRGTTPCKPRRRKVALDKDPLLSYKWRRYE